jgi:hypothetical protein
MLGYFPLAVIGPIAGSRFGLGRACCDCTEALKGRVACRGFSSGCLCTPRSAPRERQAASSRIKR